MSEQQYVKNTDKPNADSYLWQLGDGWKVSQKTGDVYSSIDAITDEVLGTTLTDISETGKIDIIELEGYFFVPNKFVDQKGKVSWSVFAFENRVKANKKLEDIKKFANYQPKTVPKPQSTGQQTFSASKPITASTVAPTRSTVTVNGTNHTVDEVREKVLLKQNDIITFTDPTPVVYDNKELITTMIQDGFSFLPRTIVERNFWEQPEYDQETGQQVGTKLIFLMGRIINVKIPDST